MGDENHRVPRDDEPAVEGRNADGRVHEGEFADVGATVNAWLGGKAPSRGIPGQAIVEP